MTNQLTQSDKFYISSNKDKSVKELSVAIEKEEALIKAYLISLDQKSPKKKKGDSALFNSLTKKKGAVALSAETVIASEQMEKESRQSEFSGDGASRYRGVDGEDITKIRNTAD